MPLPQIIARTLALAALAFSFMSAAHAQSTPEAVSRQWMQAFNAGDMAKVSALNSTVGASIIDEFAPYTWTGPTAFADWGVSFEADARAHGITEPKVTMGPLLVNNTTATQAYLVFPAVYTYRQKGVPMREDGRDVIVLRKEGDAWKVVSWAWTGTVPKLAK